MGIVYHVSVVSATGVGGIYPFVVACFDGNIDKELFKTHATNAGEIAYWNFEHVIDLKTEMAARQEANQPEPTYLTFFLFDTGAPGIPSLGSAGVLLSTVKEKGTAQGEFPIVNGTGTLNVVVRLDKMRRGQLLSATNAQAGEQEEGVFGGYNAAKIAGVVGAGALAAGLAGVAIHQVRKKKKNEGEEGEGEEGAEEEDGEQRSGAGGFFRNWWDSSSSSSDEDKAEQAAAAVQNEETNEAEAEPNADGAAEDGAEE